MRALEDEARRDQIETLALSVNNPNPAKRLYEQLGYRTVEDDGESSVRFSTWTGTADFGFAGSVGVRYPHAVVTGDTSTWNPGCSGPIAQPG